MKNKISMFLAIVILILPVVYSVQITGKTFLDTNIYSVTITNDYSYPTRDDYDYGLRENDIVFNSTNPNPGDTISITAKIHNYGLCQTQGAYGWYSPEGRSCWAEWDFSMIRTEIVDIGFRCWDDVSVDWRVELDGVHLTSPTVPGVGSNTHWKIVTIHNVTISAGSHTLFLGTYQMDFYPDIHLDWIQIGSMRIEAETYQRMGGNDPNPDLRGMSIKPCGANPPAHQNLKAQIWLGNPAIDGTLLYEDFVGKTNIVSDVSHSYPGNTYTVYYIENEGVGIISYSYVVQSSTDEIFIVIDPNDVLIEKDETNNIVGKIINNTGPYADFKCSPRNQAPFKTVFFTDLSTGDIVTWWWDFGDGYYSDVRHPMHDYYEYGGYIVSLTVTDNYGLYDTIEKKIEIQ